MHNSNLKELNEKNAKALATAAKKFLKSKGVDVQHTMALDLAGVLAGFNDWHGLQAAIAQAEQAQAATPVKMSYEDFLKTFKPLKNRIDENANGDGYGFETYGPELEAVKAAYAKNPGTVWTVVDSDGTSYVTDGYQHVNRMFYFITRKAAEKGRFYEIPYGHDESDLKFEVSVLDRATGQEEVLDTRYGPSMEDVLNLMEFDIDDAVKEATQKGGKPVILVKQLND